MLAPVIEVVALTKEYRSRVAVSDLTVTVHPGRVTGFLGPNGSGKTTTMRCVLGLTRPTAGTTRVLGRPYRELAHPMRRVGALIDPRARHPGRTAHAHLRALAQSNGLPAYRVDDVLELVGLGSVAHDRVRGFSLGMGQRLGIAAALLGDPPVVVLDEPVNGLDPEGIRWVRTLAHELAGQGRTVFVSSHLMSEMALTADHLLVIGRGRILADCSTAEFVAQHAASHVRVRSPQHDEVATLLRREGLDVAAHGGELRVHGLDPAGVGELVGRSGLLLHELTLVRSSLEDAFMTLTAASVEYSASVQTPAGASR